MCKECKGHKEFKEYKMPYIANGDKMYYNSFDELTDNLKDKYRGKETKKGKDAYIDFINKLNTKGDKLISNYVNNTTKVRIYYNKCGHAHPEGKGVTPSDYKSGRDCSICCGKMIVKGVNDLTATHPELAKEWHPIKNRDLEPTQVSSGSNKKVWWLGKCGHEWEALIYNRTRINGKNCPYCANKKVLRGFNDIATTHPQYIKYFVNIENAYIHTYASNDEVEMKCPNCGATKVVCISNLIFQGFCCSNCGDGVKYPEKVLALLLNSLNIKFKKQLKFDGYKFLYDFHLIDYDIIIEVHGGQHYNIHRQSNWKSYEEEHENDLIKYDIAVLNNYEYNKNYFVIDARESNIEWLRNSVNNCLFFQQFDLNNIDWKEIDKEAQKSLKVEICLYWKEQKEINEDLTTFNMADIFNISRSAITNWLNWGSKSGLCVYNGEEEFNANKKRQSKFVYLIKQDGTKWYDKVMSQRELARLTGISNSTIYCRANDGKPLLSGNNTKYDSKYIGSYIVEEDKLEEFLLNLNK